MDRLRHITPTEVLAYVHQRNRSSLIAFLISIQYVTASVTYTLSCCSNGNALQTRCKPPWRTDSVHTYSARICDVHRPSRQLQQESRAVARKPRDAAAAVFGSKFADNIHYKFKSSQASKARLHSAKRTGAKQNLMQSGHSRSFKVTYFGVSGKAIRD